MRAAWLLVGMSLFGCDEATCREGETKACVGSDGCSGSRVCGANDDFGPCSCTPPAASPSSSDPAQPPPIPPGPGVDGPSVAARPTSPAAQPTTPSGDASVAPSSTADDTQPVTDEVSTDGTVSDESVTDDSITDETTAATDDTPTDPTPSIDAGPFPSNLPPSDPVPEEPYEPGTGPVVVFLVDQSSSMFASSVSEFGTSLPFGAAADNWTALRAALGTLPASSAETRVELGLTTYTGQIEGTCPISQEIVVPGVNTPASVTRTLPTSQDGAPPFAGQTPTGESLASAYQALLSSPLPGSKHVVIITDGDPDTCLHPDPQCGQDFTVSIAQAAKAAGVTTHVVGLTDGVGLDFLESLAHAGQGLPVPPPLSPEAQDCLARQTGSMGGSFDPNNWRASALADYAADDVTFGERRSFTPKSEQELAELLASLLVRIRDGG